MRKLLAGVTAAFAALAATVLLAGVAPAAAHVHFSDSSEHDQPLANGATHPAATDGFTTICGEDPDPWDSAAYGLESAHHGPDSGTPGKADGCYQADSDIRTSDDVNPAIE